MNALSSLRRAGRAWLTAVVALCLALGGLLGIGQGLYAALQRGYDQSATLVVLLHMVKTRMNAAVLTALLIGAVVVVVFLAVYLVLRGLRYTVSRAAVGAGVGTCLVLVWARLGYALNKSAWYPDFWSVTGITSNLLTVVLFAMLGLVVWRWLQPRRDTLLAIGMRLSGKLASWVLVGCGLGWLLVNAAFWITNAQAVPQHQAQYGVRPRLVLIGLDGATWKVINPLMQQGKLPNLKRLMEAGTYGEFRTLEPTISPVIWTTIATGKAMSEHGITDFVTQDGEEGKLVTSNMRRVKALWNILSDRERSVGVVGWFVSWPAERVRGFVVSSYAGLGRSWKGRIQQDVPQVTYPEVLIEELGPLMEEVEGQLDKHFQEVFPRLDMPHLNDTQRQVVEDTREVLLADMLNARVGLHLFETYAPDFFAMYLGGTDVVGHRFWKYKYPQALPYKITPEHVAMLGDVVSNYYLFADGVLGRVLDAIDPNTIVMVISDHGMEPYMPRDRNDDRTSGAHGDAPSGIIVISGANVRRGPLQVPASVFDIAPTVLYLSGLPLAQDMLGQPLFGALTPAFVQQHAPAYVRSYEGSKARQTEAARESDVDTLLKKRLKSLGYIN